MWWLRETVREHPEQADVVRQFALGGLTRRLQIIDVPLETVFA